MPRVCVILVFFFFKQKTAYDMRISDWSSDVCSSDLKGVVCVIRKISLAVLLATAPVATFAMGSDNSSADKPDEEKIIFKLAVSTGSIMSRRLCNTNAAWKAIAEQGNAGIDPPRAMHQSRPLGHENLLSALGRPPPDDPTQ